MTFKKKLIDGVPIKEIKEAEKMASKQRKATLEAETTLNGIFAWLKQKKLKLELFEYCWTDNKGQIFIIDRNDTGPIGTISGLVWIVIKHLDDGGLMARESGRLQIESDGTLILCNNLPYECKKLFGYDWRKIAGMRYYNEDGHVGRKPRDKKKKP